MCFQPDSISCFYLEAFTPSRGEQVTDCSLKRSLYDSPFPSPLLLLSSVVLLCAGGIRLLGCVRSSLCQLFTLPVSLPSLACCQASPPSTQKKKSSRGNGTKKQKENSPLTVHRFFFFSVAGMFLSVNDWFNAPEEKNWRCIVCSCLNI